MSSPKPIDSQWLSDTLTPFLRYAFGHALRSNARIKPYIQRAVNACKTNPKNPGQNSDAQFEQVLQTVERRCRGLPVQNALITDNLEALAQFLIERAQVKGPYELPNADTPGGGDRAGGKIAVLSASLPPKPVPGDILIDPRLCSALPGQFASSDLSGTLSKAEDQFYRIQDLRRRNLLTMPPPTMQQLPSTVDKLQTATPGSHVTRGHQQRQASVPQPGHQQGYTPVPHSGHQQRQASVSHTVHQRRHTPVPQLGPRQGFGVLIPQERSAAYKKMVSSQTTANTIHSPSEKACIEPLGTARKSAHPNTSAPRQHEARTSTPTPTVQTLPSTAPHPPQTMPPAPKQQQPAQTTLFHPPILASEPRPPQQLAVPTAPNPAHRESTTPPDLPQCSTAAELEAEIAAFRSLPRAEKMAKLTKILTSLQANPPNKAVVVPPQSAPRKRKTPVGTRRVTRQEARKRRDAAIVAPSSLRRTLVPSEAEVAYHPGYSNVRCRFQAPEFGGVKNVPSAHSQVEGE